MEVTLADLEEITGVTYKTLRKRLSSLEPRRTNKEVYYPLKQALRLVTDKAKKPAGLSLDNERARLAAAQADRTEMELAKLRGELVDASEMTDEYAKRVLAARNKLLGIPTKLAARFKTLSIPADLEILAEELIYESLEELAGSDASD